MNLIYIDESGDHAEAATNPEYPIFVVVACVFSPENYARRFVPSLLEFKLRHWSHESVVLHEREIRKSIGEFSFLFDRAVREIFLQELSGVIKDSGAELAAVVWDKRGSSPVRSYADCLVRLLGVIEARHGNHGEPSVAVIESRGNKEDEGVRIAVVQSGLGPSWRLHFAPKARNIPGLQLADLCARPIGLKVLAPERKNRAFDETIGRLLRPRAEGEIGHPIIFD